MTDCAYCESEVERHDPVTLVAGVDEGPADYFCNHACLHAWVEENGLVFGASCEWSPSAE